MEVIGFNGNEWDLMDINWDLKEFSQKNMDMIILPSWKFGKVCYGNRYS